MSNPNTLSEDTFIGYKESIPDNFPTEKEIDPNIKAFLSLDLETQTSQLEENPKLIHIRDRFNGNSLMHYSVINQNYPLIDLLLKYKINIDVRNNLHETPLHLAIMSGKNKMINLMLEKNSNPDIQNIEGDTPTHLATSKGDYKVIKLLLLFNANINIKNNRNLSAIELALISGQKKCYEVLYKAINHKHSATYSNFSSSINNYLLYKNDVNKNSDLTLNNHNKENKTDLFYDKGVIYDQIRRGSGDIKPKNINNIENGKMVYVKKKVLPYSDNRARIPTPSFSPLTNSMSISTSSTKFSNFMNRKDDNYVNDEEVIRLLNKKSEKFTDGEMKRKICSENITYSEDNYAQNQGRKSLVKLLKKNSILIDKKKKEQITFEDKNNENEDDDEDDIIINDDGDSNEEDNNSQENESSENNMNNRISISDPKNLKEDLYKFLNEIGMEKYQKQIYDEGYDDINLIVNQMKSGFRISDDNLKEIGITKAGDRAKILIRLQEVSRGFRFSIPHNKVYFVIDNEFEEGKYDLQIIKIINWLKELRMENYIENFYNNGYHSLELMYVQMVSFYPLNDKCLEEDIGIDKVGYRMRILNKMKEDSENYVKNLKREKFKLSLRKSKLVADCQCSIF